MAFVHRSPTCTAVLQPGAIELLPEQLSALGVRRPVLVAGHSVRHTRFFKRLLALLPQEALIDLPPTPAHSSAAWVVAAVRAAKAHGADGFVSVGGGSASDSAKACALLWAEGGELPQHAIKFTPPDQLQAPVLSQPKLPILAVVGTASGAELTPSLGVSNDHGKKMIFSDPKLCCRVVLMDPVANLEVPPALMLSTGMNALAHAVEGLYSATRTPVTDALALEALHRLPAALLALRARPDDVNVRSDLLEAAHLAGLVIANARTCLHHAICHAIGAYCGVGHGDVNAVMLPHVVNFNALSAIEPLRRGAQAWGLEPDGLVRGINDLQQKLGVARRLRDIGVRESDLAAVAEKTMGERGLYFNPRRVSDSSEILNLLQSAY
jgi:alcohol dehydrogenase